MASEIAQDEYLDIENVVSVQHDCSRSERRSRKGEQNKTKKKSGKEL